MSIKNAVIIGVGPGLGLALVEKFASKGFKVCMVARDLSKLEKYKQDLLPMYDSLFSYSADAGDSAALNATLETIIQEQGSPDLLIYNVSLLRPAPPTKIDYDSFLQDFQINVGGLLVAYQAVFKTMKSKGGTILITGGGLSLNPFYEFASLGVGKAGLRNLAISLAQEAKDTSMRVYTITINGMIEPGTRFDPKLIADKFQEIFSNGLPPGEYEFIFQ